jgi:hypothetical protein
MAEREGQFIGSIHQLQNEYLSRFKHCHERRNKIFKINFFVIDHVPVQVQMEMN